MEHPVMIYNKKTRYDRVSFPYSMMARVALTWVYKSEVSSSPKPILPEWFLMVVVSL